MRAERTLFQDLSFSLQPGQVLFVRGPNGVGKSSLLRLLAGLLQPAAGSIEYAGTMAWLGHQDGLSPRETAREAIRFRARLHGGTGVDPAIAALQLEPFAEREARLLSAGQRRRAALAGVIASGARLWLLDEPTTALDSTSRELFFTALRRHLAAGGMAVLTTHEDIEWEGASTLTLPTQTVIPGDPGSYPGETRDLRQDNPDRGPGSPLRSVRDDRKKEKFFTPILARELRLAARQSGQIVTAVLFFILVIMLLAFGVGPDPELLQKLAPGAVWTAALLACLLTLDRLFAADQDSGALDLMRASPVAGEILAAAKMLAHWLGCGVPMLLSGLAAALLLHLTLATTGAMLASLLLGLPTLSLIGGAIAALTLRAQRGGLVLTLLVLPLFIPVLIFGAAAIQNALAGDEVAGPLTFLVALLALALPLAPIAAAAALDE